MISVKNENFPSLVHQSLAFVITSRSCSNSLVASFNLIYDMETMKIKLFNMKLKNVGWSLPLAIFGLLCNDTYGIAHSRLVLYQLFVSRSLIKKNVGWVYNKRSGSYVIKKKLLICRIDLKIKGHMNDVWVELKKSPQEQA